MSLAQALQERETKCSTKLYPVKRSPFGQFAAENKKRLTDTSWSIGDIALHKKWGEGTVLEVSW